MAGESTIVIAACVQWGGRFYNGTHIHTTIYHALSARLQFELGLAGDFLGCHFEPRMFPPRTMHCSPTPTTQLLLNVPTEYDTSI